MTYPKNPIDKQNFNGNGELRNFTDLKLFMLLVVIVRELTTRKLVKSSNAKRLSGIVVDVSAHISKKLQASPKKSKEGGKS